MVVTANKLLPCSAIGTHSRTGHDVADGERRLLERGTVQKVGRALDPEHRVALAERRRDRNDSSPVLRAVQRGVLRAVGAERSLHKKTPSEGQNTRADRNQSQVRTKKSSRTYLVREHTRGCVLGAVEGGELRERRLLPRRRPERHQRRGGAGLAREGPVHRWDGCCSCCPEVS
jgi:hypothetical protein